MTSEGFDQPREGNIELAQATGPDLRSDTYSSPGQQVMDWVNALIPGRNSQPGTESQSGNTTPSNTGSESPATKFNRLIGREAQVDAMKIFGEFIDRGFDSTNGTLSYRTERNLVPNDDGTNLRPGDILIETGNKTDININPEKRISQLLEANNNTQDPNLAVFAGRRSDGTPMVTTVVGEPRTRVATIPYSEWLKEIRDAGRPDPQILRPYRTNNRDARSQNNSRIVTGYRLPELHIG